MFRTDGMSQEDKDFEDHRCAIIKAFDDGVILKNVAFERLKDLGLSDDVALEDLN